MEELMERLIKFLLEEDTAEELTRRIIEDEIIEAPIA